MQGKTRCFDKDESFGIIKNSMSSNLNSTNTTSNTTSSTIHNQHFTNLLNKTLSGQHPSPSPAFDTSTSSNRTTSTKYDSFELNSSKDHHRSNNNISNDNVDGVHSRLRFSSPPPVSPNSKSGDLFSSKFGRVSNSIENLSSTQALKNLSNSTRQHHNQSLLHESSLSAKAATASTSTFQEQIRESTRQYQQQEHYTTATSNFTNGVERQNGFNHGDIVVDGDGLGVVLVHSLVTVTISSEFGHTSLENINVEVSGKS